MARRVPLLSFLCQKDNPDMKDISTLKWKFAGRTTCNEIVNELHKPSYKIVIGENQNARMKPREIYFTDFTSTNAFNTFALGGLYSISVMQYIFCKYKIRLRYPYLPLIASTVPSGNIEYYPIELLDVIYEN